MAFIDKKATLFCEAQISITYKSVMKHEFPTGHVFIEMKAEMIVFFLFEAVNKQFIIPTDIHEKIPREFTYSQR